MRTALTAAMVVPSTMFKVYDPPNSGVKIIYEAPSSKYDFKGHSFLIRKLVFMIIPIACEGSIRTADNNYILPALKKMQETLQNV